MERRMRRTIAAWYTRVSLSNQSHTHNHLMPWVTLVFTQMHTCCPSLLPPSFVTVTREVVNGENRAQQRSIRYCVQPTSRRMERKSRQTTQPVSGLYRLASERSAHCNTMEPWSPRPSFHLANLPTNTLGVSHYLNTTQIITCWLTSTIAFGRRLMPHL